MLGDYAFPGNIFRGRHKATPIENAGGGETRARYERTRGTKPIMRVTGVEFVTVLHCNRTQPDTNRNSVNAFNGGGEKFSDSPGGGFCARFSSFQTPALDDFCTSPRPTHPLLVNYFLVSFPFHPRYFLCARSMVNVGDLTYASDN